MDREVEPWDKSRKADSPDKKALILHTTDPLSNPHWETFTVFKIYILKVTVGMEYRRGL